MVGKGTGLFYPKKQKELDRHKYMENNAIIAFQMTSHLYMSSLWKSVL